MLLWKLAQNQVPMVLALQAGIKSLAIDDINDNPSHYLNAALSQIHQYHFQQTRPWQWKSLNISPTASDVNYFDY